MTSKLIIAFFVGAFAGIASFAETSDAGVHRPVAAEVLSYMDVHSYHHGSPVYVKVKAAWEEQGCYFFDGQVLQGRVELATWRGKDQKESQLAISFPNMRCVGSKATLNLVLVAVEWEAGLDKIADSQYPSVVQLANPRIGTNGFSMDGMTMMALNQRSRNQLPLKAGDVLGVDGVTLEIGGGPERSSLLKSTKRDVHLEKESLLLLVPESVAFPKGHETGGTRPLERPSVGNLPGPVPAGDDTISLKAPPLPAPVEFQPCEPPVCAVDLPSSDRETHGTPSKSIGIRELGYAPRPQQQLGDLDDDEALGWLGPQQLLIAFNPHRLIDRAGQTSTGTALRRIHAIVIEPATSKILSVADWFLPDSGEFLWQLAGGRVLVHVGNELRIYGVGMQIERQIPLDGPLKFVRLSPNGELMAIAIARETHTPEQHASLRESLNTEPPENVEIRVLDKNFETIAQATTSSRIIPPALLNEGQVQLLAKSNRQYRVALARWNGESTTVTQFSSACIPEMSSFAPDLLLVSTCELSTGAHEYRVLRPNGKVVLRGRPDPQEAGQSAQGNERNFALKSLHATQVMMRGNHFQGSDLDYEEVRIFQSNDGRRLTTVRLQSPPPSHGGYALSPDGAQLAVIADAKVNLFPVPLH
ncbi:hypothetical protein P8935_02150 [Telmatobacter sp. DSM 110680]|uniref:Uncharacterized protein n=1 Tax=Telmatobacter sp. DSM 110680 TaxID=3036704 RepID=A0AAU7DJ88_9BACT